MSKYKICKFVNKNNEEWYQVLKRGWVFWHYMSSYARGGPLRNIDRLSSIEQAQKHIKEDIEYKKRGITKKVECFDYQPPAPKGTGFPC
jgi:hypothetical protein